MKFQTLELTDDLFTILYHTLTEYLHTDCNINENQEECIRILEKHFKHNFTQYNNSNGYVRLCKYINGFDITHTFTVNVKNRKIFYQGCLPSNVTHKLSELNQNNLLLTQDEIKHLLKLSNINYELLLEKKWYLFDYINKVFYCGYNKWGFIHCDDKIEKAIALSFQECIEIMNKLDIKLSIYKI